MSFYITTPIYYVNDTPHIGHAYTTVVADVLSRYHRFFGETTFFLTGTDEHGQKVQQAAAAKGVTPQAHVDQTVQGYMKAWEELQIQPDFFIRTTMDLHKKVVQELLQELYEKGDIYSQDYEGWYSVSEEQFYTEKELVNGRAPTGSEVQKVVEKNYFFKMSKYQQRLIDHIEKHPNFVYPEVRRNEVLGFLRQPLADLCISRPKARLTWGIELPFDKDFVTYVWFDALTNYVSALGYKKAAPSAQFQKFWPSAIHLIGKDILTFHAVYWPTMLMALEIPLPKQIFAHGWWLTKDNEKMSKSKGVVVKPLDAKDIVGVDGLRYFLTRDIYLGNDAQFSIDLVVNRVNADLANNLGNLLSRTTNLIQKYFAGKVPEIGPLSPESENLKRIAATLGASVQKEIVAMAPNLAIGHVMDFLTEANKYLEHQAPWKTAKTNLEQAAEPLYVSLEVLRVAATLLLPVMPQKMRQLLKLVGWNENPNFVETTQWGLIKPGTAVEKPEPLFPRVEQSVS